MNILTWVAVLILGPGAVLVFIWFVVDFLKILRRP